MKPTGHNHALYRAASAAGMAAIVAATLSALASQRYLFADTSFFLVRQLETGSFFSNDPPRMFAQLLMQMPMQAVLSAGVTDLGALAAIYGATLYAGPLLLLLLCYHYCADKREFLFPLASYLLAGLPAYSFIISEAHLAAGIFWLSAILIHRPGAPGAAQWLLLPALAVLASRCYESGALLLPLLILMLALRGKLRLERASIPWWLLAGILASGAVMSAQGVLDPRDTVNKGRFLQALVQLSATSSYHHAATAVLAAAFLWRPREAGAPLAVILWCCALLALALLGLFAVQPALLDLQLAYPSRALLLVVPLALSACYLLQTRLSVRRQAQLLRSLALLCLFCASYQLAAQLNASYQWVAYQGVLKRTQDDAGPRVADFRDTALGGDYEGRVALASQHWRWTLPLLNIILSRDGQVRRYLYDDRAAYRPYDLRWLPDLRRYGIAYGFSERVQPGELLGFRHAKLQFANWYRPGPGFRWAEGGAAEIHFRSEDRNGFSGHATLELGVRGEQEVEVWLNNMLQFKGILDRRWGKLELEFDPRLLRTGSDNTLAFWFSNPQRASERDSRVLAGKFHSLTLH